MNTNPLKKKTEEFLRNITKKDKVCIVHDTDPDGICSAVIMAKCVEQLRDKKIDMHMPLDKKVKGISPQMEKQIKKAKITKLITTDFSLDQKLEQLKRLEKNIDLLVIDHHKLYNNYVSEETIIYKPQLIGKIDPSRYCTAKLTYDIAKNLVNTDKLDWISATGCIADISTEPWMNWLKQVLKKYKAKQNKDLFKTKIGQIAAIISSTEVYNEKLVPECYKIVYNAKKPEDVLKSKLAKYRKVIDDELKKHVQQFKKAEKHGQTRIYELKSKYRINSVLSTILGLKYPHNTIIIINKSKPFINISARRGDQKIPVNTLLENAIKGFKGANAGGHIPSAGAGFNKKYLNTFKQRIIEAS